VNYFVFGNAVTKLS